MHITSGQPLYIILIHIQRWNQYHLTLSGARIPICIITP